MGSEGQAWRSFFESPQNNVGLFLRNAVFYGNGNVQFYKDKGVIPQTAIALGTREDGFTVRLAPSVSTESVLRLTEEFLSQSNIAIYGWVDSTSTGTAYWLLVTDTNNRLVWVAADGINHDPNILNPQNRVVDVAALSPIRPFSPSDLSIIIGG